MRWRDIYTQGSRKVEEENNGWFNSLEFGISLVECQRWTSFNKAQGTSSKESYRNGRNGRYYGDSSQQNIETESPSKLQQNKNSSSSGGGVGAWGIIAITLTVILSGLGVYYFVTFYPIVCKKERMYDVMEMTTV